ncbi:MAG: hypothetical protein EOP06_21040 [Proteobacteria bacterium]|nr:MAG: hypothetical protein EOP06_21040 [Pseudomonadota bacterium]
MIGGIDEMTDYTLRLFKLAGFIKPDDQAPYEVTNPTTAGAVFSEGATFFALADNRTESTYCELVDVQTINTLSVDEVLGFAREFLQANNVADEDLDAIVLGINGDVTFDSYYNEIRDAFATIPQVYYKHLSGEYNTASAFGLYIGAYVLRSQKIAPECKLNDVQRSSYKKVLLYNQYRGIDHSFTLIST